MDGQLFPSKLISTALRAIPLLSHL